MLNLVTDALADDSADVRTAACICLKSVTRSIKVCNAITILQCFVLIFMC